MEPIRSLKQLVDDLRGAPPKRVAVAAGHDPNSIQAAARAAAEGIARVTLFGDAARIAELCASAGLDRSLFDVEDFPDLLEAGTAARDRVREGGADVLMKGLIGTDKYMRLILDKANGLLPPGAILTHIAVFEIPAFVQRHGKLLFASDVAIIPAPDLATKVKIAACAVAAARSFGIERPRVALLAATEKASDRMRATVEAAEIARRTDWPGLEGAIVDGPLSLDLAISPEACAIKGFQSPVDGSADVLIFPNIEAGNVFYKAVSYLGGARMAAAVVGTTAPCVLTSRADSEESKFHSIAFGCRLAAARAGVFP